MIQRRYSGVSDPRGEFERLRPAVERLEAMRLNCKPFGQDYLILTAARDGLVTAAFHFTHDPFLYGAHGHSD